jgi:hypothetical protein
VPSSAMLARRLHRESKKSGVSVCGLDKKSGNDYQGSRRGLEISGGVHHHDVRVVTIYAL